LNPMEMMMRNPDARMKAITGGATMEEKRREASGTVVRTMTSIAYVMRFVVGGHG
jgi:hypothetical protein